MKQKLYIVAPLALVVLMITACSSSTSISSIASKAQSVLSQASSSSSTITTTDITAALKEALTLGVQQGVEILGADGGYYNDVATRIGLPEEALVITENISKLPGGETLVNSVIESINAAASDAVSDVTPIFTAAITSMTISDAANILAGDSTAATTYFKSKTKTELKSVFAGYIDSSLDKELIGSVSASSAWNTMTTQWNKVASSAVGKIAGWNEVNTDLSDYLTEEAVETLYTKVGEKETAIRTDVSERTTALLKKVFGSK